MRILLVDDFHSIGQTAAKLPPAADCEIKSTGRVDAALDLIAHNEFDCIVLDLSTVGDFVGIVEIRSMLRKAAVVLMGTSSVKSLTEDSLISGYLEFRPIPSLISSISDLAEPVLLVAPEVDPALIEDIKNQSLRTCTANTLHFAMNLLVDGWCQIILLKAAIRELPPDHVAIVHRMRAREAVILASGLHQPGIIFVQKPVAPKEFAKLIRDIVENRPIPCGLMRGR